MVVVEAQQRALAVADLEEAHHPPLVVGMLAGRLAALDGGRDPLGHDRRLEVRRRAGLRERQVGRVAEGEDVRVDRRPASVWRSVGSQPPGAGARPESMRNCCALVRRHEDEQVVRQLLALEALHDLALGVDRLDVEERVELDALALEDRRRHLADALDGEGAPDGRAEVQLALLPQAPFAQLGLDEEGDLERRRRALVGHAGDADDDAAAVEASSAWRSARAASAV